MSNHDESFVETVPAAVLLEINGLCVEFKKAWGDGQSPRIEDFAARISADVQVAALRELIAQEVDLRWTAGQTAETEEYHQRFPQYALAVNGAFSILKGRRRSAEQLVDTDSFVGDDISDTDHKRPLARPNRHETPQPQEPPQPKRLGRFKIEHRLGRGAFGDVYLADDPELNRKVAIKVPRRERFSSPEDMDIFVQEARTAAGLTHPGIVTIHDVVREGDSLFIVQEYIAGQDLSKYLESQKSGLPAEQAVGLLMSIAEALSFAHQKGFVHRDLKPANILLDAQLRPRVADFGLAVHETIQRRRRGDRSGTPAYMSPEQVRGETHRLDGRSDIWSLGVILYELLTGRRPFHGDTRDELFDEIKHRDPTPPRQRQQQVPAELDRICLKCLNKQVTDRYSSAHDLVDDLRHWSAPRASAPQPPASVKIVPKGLRSFDASDADFFLELLPGQRDRDGLPESIRFWKTRLEETDTDPTFAVGLVYGPSGCGKSSLVKAGLLPRLAPHVLPIYIEATPADTEVRLLKGLRKACPAIPADASLPEVCESLREGNWLPVGRKVVLVLDQFEQWLHAHGAEQDTQLVTALRHCDGGRLQAIVMVRDDFAMAAARFMRALDTRIVEGHNFATVDLFDVPHAASVLKKFGQAFGRLPANTGQMSADEQSFVTDVVTGLAQEGKVVSVRLALFAEMVKTKPWTASTLVEVGGTQGIGVNFLEETFSSRDANPDHRLHAVAARGILKALLPELGSDIKGGMRSQAALQEAAGYQDRPSDFAELLRILDSELRLITPTDPEGIEKVEERREKSEIQGVTDRSSSTSHSTLHSSHFYQLTHDYLVPSLRDWLTRKQKETRKGRADLKLAERSFLWNAKPENRYLPSLVEWLSIRTLSESKHWTAPQRAMMGRAARVHGVRSTFAVVCTCVLIVAGIGITRQTDERRNQAEATRLVEGLLAANTAQVSTSLASLKDFRTWADPQLQQAFKDSPADSDAKLHAGLALVAEGQTVDPAVLEFLQKRMLTVTPAQFAPVRALLEPHKTELIPAWWKLATDDQQPAIGRFHAACALAAFGPDSSHAEREQSSPHAPREEPPGHIIRAGWNDPSFTTFIAEQLVSVSPEYIGEFKELLRPVAPQLVPALSDIFKDPARGELAKTLATSLLADYAAKDPDTLTELVLAADAVSDKSLFPVLQQHQAAAVKNLEVVLDQRLERDWKDTPLDPAWTEPSPAVRAQIESAHGLITERFAFCQDMPLSEFPEVAETLRASGYRPTRVRPHLSLLPLEGGEGGRRPDEGVASLAATPTLQVAAIFARDNLRWHVDPSLSKADLPVPDAPATKDGLLLTDIAIIPSTDESAEPHFIAVWSEPANADEQRCVLLDVTKPELTDAEATLKQQGFTSQSTISVRTDASGQRHYSGIWSNQGALSEPRLAYAGFELVEQPQWDVAVAPAAKLADPLESFRQQLAEIEKLPAEKLDDPQVRQTRVAAHYQLGNLEPALADLDFLVSKEIVTATVLQYRTLTLARLGKADEAKESLTKYLATDAGPSFKSYVQIQVAAWLGEFEEASSLLESAVTASSENADDLYNVVCAAALSSQALSAKDPSQSAKFADRTFELLLQMVAQGYSKADQLKGDADFASLHGDPRFTELLSQLEQPATYAALWRADIEFESKLLAMVPMDDVVEQMKSFTAKGYRPFAIAMDVPQSTQISGLTPTARQQEIAVVPEQASTVPSPPGKGEKVADRPDEGARAAAGLPTSALCSVILHRPLIPDAAKESLALQQAAAATALLRLNAAGKVWPLFQDQPDPRLRSYVLHRLATYGVDPQSLFTQLNTDLASGGRQSPDTASELNPGVDTPGSPTSPSVPLANVASISRQRSLILGLGEFARAKLLSPEQQAAVIADLAKRYADDPDSGIHGAAEWTLRQLGADAAIAEVRAAYSTGTVVGDRRWYLTKTGLKSPTTSGMTFAIIDADDEFLMGSPVSEAERFQGPTGKNEIHHRRRIGRRFAIGTHEVTVAQFRAFRSDHAFDRTKAREEDAPANMITWYDAAAYCNWLSKEEGLPPEEWCYDPNQEFVEGMALVPNYLQRTGYRLPSEAEWEYACRAGTTTARYFSETETLLGEYAWYTKTSGDKWMLPVGSLRPNGVGLFDMQGNVLEWCQDAALFYDTDLEAMGDKEQVGMLDNSGTRVLRGGSFTYIASYVRSAFRFSLQPDLRLNFLGFRVGRTLNPVPFTALPPAEGGKNFAK